MSILRYPHEKSDPRKVKTMKLYLVQHGEALPKEVDPERGLSDQGKEDVTHIAAFLAKGGIQVERIFHSSKKRAEQTARLFESCLSSGAELCQKEGISPLDPVDNLAREVDNWQDDTILVGHLPYMGKLVSRLVAEKEDVPLVNFQPGSVVCLERDETGSWIIVLMVRPELLSGDIKLKENQ